MSLMNGARKGEITMAVDTSKTYFSNSIQGIPQVGAEFSIYDTDSTPKFALGTRFTRQDGNAYVYSHFGADTAAGVMTSQDLSESSLLNVDIVLGTSSVSGVDGDAGEKFIEITAAGVTADQFAGGYFSVEDDTGEGYQYRIKGNDATGDTASGNVRIELYDKIQVSMIAATTGNIQGCLYANLEASTTTDVAAAGVSCAAMTTASTAYGWVQVAGVATVLTSGTLVLGAGCKLAAAGAVAPEVSTEILDVVAVCLSVGATGEHSIVSLKLS